MRPSRARPFATRFHEDPETGCLEWQDARTPEGYGKFLLAGRWHRAHRYAWELVYGAIPDGLYVCHSCDNPPCCNIDHLFLGTNRDNQLDAAAKGRAGRMPWKLTNDQVESIRSDPREATVVAVEYGVRAAHIRCIRRGASRAVARVQVAS